MNISNEFITTLKSVLADEQVFLNEAIGADFAHDELPGGKEHMPEVVVKVSSTEEVSAVLKTCSEYSVPVTVRGAGTGRAGGSVPVNGGLVLSVKEMNKVLGFDEEAKTVTVQPGVLLQDVMTEASSHGLYYPPDPGEKTATIGGNVSTNAGGPCATKYGTTQDYVLNATVVLSDGSVKKLSENDELKNVIGSEGTLAVITEITLKLINKPQADVILLLPFVDTESCINAAIRIKEENTDAAILEYLDTDIVEFSGNVTGNPVFPVEMDGERVGATLMVTLEGESEDELDEKMEALAELSEELECLDILVVDTPTLKRDTWAAHDAFHTSTETAKSEDEINITVPADKMAELIEFAKSLAEEKGLKAMAYSHVGSGGLHIHVISDMAKADFMPVMAPVAESIYEKCIELGGCVRGEYGYGYAKKSYVCEEKRSELLAVKAALDPKSLMNPGKVV